MLPELAARVLNDRYLGAQPAGSLNSRYSHSLPRNGSTIDLLNTTRSLPDEIGRPLRQSRPDVTQALAREQTRHERNVRIFRFCARGRQHRVDLTAVMGLVVKHVDRQQADVLREFLADRRRNIGE